MTDVSGLVVRPSAHDVDETVRRFIDRATQAGLTIFADIDHGRAAAEVGMDLRPTRLVIFGHPKGGTPLMQAQQTIGIDLPLKALAWQDESGAVFLGYIDPEWVADRHGAPSPAPALKAGIETLVTAAAA